MVTALTSTNDRTKALTPDQLYAIGYGDGLANRATDRKYSESLDYQMGHVQGYRQSPFSLHNVQTSKEAPLERGWGDELLNEGFAA